MRVVIKAAVLLAAVWIGVVGFAPKRQLYFALEHRLDNEGITLHEGRIAPSFDGLDIRDLGIFYEGLKLAKVGDVRISTTLVSTTLHARGVEPSTALPLSAPLRIDRLTVRYVMWKPFTLTLEGNGTIGPFVGRVDLKKRTVRMNFSDPQAIGPIRRYLKHDSKKGWIYENTF
ncbi:hypothetical protein [Nitratifractor sp.]